jgi:hypothetical protein
MFAAWLDGEEEVIYVIAHLLRCAAFGPSCRSLRRKNCGSEIRAYGRDKKTG